MTPRVYGDVDTQMAVYSPLCGTDITVACMDAQFTANKLQRPTQMNFNGQCLEFTPEPAHPNVQRYRQRIK